jgi:hypothetical protein
MVNDVSTYDLTSLISNIHPFTRVSHNTGSGGARQLKPFHGTANTFIIYDESSSSIAADPPEADKLPDSSADYPLETYL